MAGAVPPRPCRQVHRAWRTQAACGIALALAATGMGLADVLPNMLALLGFGMVFFLIGVWRIKYE